MWRKHQVFPLKTSIECLLFGCWQRLAGGRGCHARSQGLPTWLRGAAGVGSASAWLAGASSGAPTSSCWSVPFLEPQTILGRYPAVQWARKPQGTTLGPETFLCRLLWWHSALQRRRRHWLLSITVDPGAAATRVCVCVHVCTHAHGPVSVHAGVCARGPVCVHVDLCLYAPLEV